MYFYGIILLLKLKYNLKKILFCVVYKVGCLELRIIL